MSAAHRFGTDLGTRCDPKAALYSTLEVCSIDGVGAVYFFSFRPVGLIVGSWLSDPLGSQCAQQSLITARELKRQEGRLMMFPH